MSVIKQLQRCRCLLDIHLDRVGWWVAATKTIAPLNLTVLNRGFGREAALLATMRLPLPLYSWSVGVFDRRFTGKLCDDSERGQRSISLGTDNKEKGLMATPIANVKSLVQNKAAGTAFTYGTLVRGVTGTKAVSLSDANEPSRSATGREPTGMFSLSNFHSQHWVRPPRQNKSTLSPTCKIKSSQTQLNVLLHGNVASRHIWQTPMNSPVCLCCRSAPWRCRRGNSSCRISWWFPCRGCWSITYYSRWDPVLWMEMSLIESPLLQNQFELQWVLLLLSSLNSSCPDLDGKYLWQGYDGGIAFISLHIFLKTSTFWQASLQQTYF